MSEHEPDGGARRWTRGVAALWFCLGLVVATLPGHAARTVEPGVNTSATHTHHHHHDHGAGCVSCQAAALTRIDGGGMFPNNRTQQAQQQAGNFEVAARWSFTATDGFNTGNQGSPITLTWGFINDGTTINGAAGEPNAGSELINFLDDLFDNDSTGGSDLTQRAWFGYFESAFGRLAALSGVTYVYEPNDDGLTLNGTINPSTLGFLGVRPDVRIGGHPVDGSSGSNTLAYNYFPSGGDMVIDTDNSVFFGSTFSNALRLRNVLMHEAGHGLGFRHVESNNSSQLMEPFVSTAFEGPQFDDLLALHRNYGDALEKNGGNDTVSDALPAVALGNGAGWAVGTDADDATRIEPFQTDFVSIDGLNDTDVYAFDVLDAISVLDVSLSQVGPTYNVGPQNGEQSPLDASSLNDLVLEVLDAAGNPIAVSDGAVAHADEAVTGLVLETGSYFLRVSGTLDAVQVYTLELGLDEPIVVIDGDYNASGDVEQEDLDLILQNWGVPFELVSAGWVSQRPEEGIVDQAELDAVLQNWGDNASPGFSPGALPEPGVVVAAAGAFVVVSRRRKMWG